MTSPRRRTRLMTPEEYLAFEERSPMRHEYVAGRVRAMGGGVARHARAINNLHFRLRQAAGGGPCEVFSQNMRLRADEDVFYYPDVVVTCTPVGDDELLVPDPCLVAEVLSPSTRRVDRGEKLVVYRRIPSVRAYLIVEANRPEVERHWRDAAGTWHVELVTPESGGRVSVPRPTAELTLDEIYRGVGFRPRLRRVKEWAPDYAGAPDARLGG